MKPMKSITTLLSALLLSIGCLAQNYSTHSGHVAIDATHYKAGQKVAVASDSVLAVYHADKGNILLQAGLSTFKTDKPAEPPLTAFSLDVAKYPRVFLAGKLECPTGIDVSKNATSKAKIKGRLALHGVTKEVEIPATITTEEGKMTLEARFNAALADYGIAIPKEAATEVNTAATIAIKCVLLPEK